MKKYRDIQFFLTFVAAVILVIISQIYFSAESPAKNSELMKQAAERAGAWMQIIQKEKEARHLISDEAHHFPAEAMLGDELSEMTTTLGALEAKKISVNPQIAALVVRWITELGLDSTDEVMVASSGSFPGIAVSTLAALQTLNQRVVLVTSVGASSFGANQPAMTILDMENILSVQGGLRYTSELVTYGCDNDNGEGFFDGGREAVDTALLRNNAALWLPASLEEAIRKRVAIAARHRIKLLINIGGNHAMLGNCVHASSMPNGLHRSVQTCVHGERGAIARIHETGIPIIHFLNITDLGLKYGISDSHTSNAALFAARVPNVWALGFFLLVLAAAVVLLRKKERV